MLCFRGEQPSMCSSKASCISQTQLPEDTIDGFFPPELELIHHRRRRPPKANPYAAQNSAVLQTLDYTSKTTIIPSLAKSILVEVNGSIQQRHIYRAVQATSATTHPEKGSQDLLNSTMGVLPTCIWGMALIFCDLLPWCGPRGSCSSQILCL